LERGKGTEAHRSCVLHPRVEYNLGGGLFNGLGTSDVVPTATLSNTNITANQADGGTAGAGIGGGIYTTGTVDVHNVVVAGNKASTSNDDVFGVLTPF
jgi:hypothetical protein